jgi:hypothetical protein
VSLSIGADVVVVKDGKAVYAFEYLHFASWEEDPRTGGITGVDEGSWLTVVWTRFNGSSACGTGKTPRDDGDRPFIPSNPINADVRLTQLPHRITFAYPTL